jgi:catechol 2,3-dioxygenase-like lactoylglutathione lyase family enzyme
LDCQSAGTARRHSDEGLIQLRPPGGWARLTKNLGAVPQERATRAGPSLSPASINYIRMRVADLARSGDFYNRVFGTELLSRATAASRIFLSGDSTLELISVAPNAAARPGIDVIGIAFSNFTLESAQRILRERGIEARNVGGPGPLSVVDPDGIEIVLSAAGVSR